MADFQRFFSPLRLLEGRREIAFSVGELAYRGHTLSVVRPANSVDVTLDTEVRPAIEVRQVGTVSQGGEGTRG